MVPHWRAEVGDGYVVLSGRAQQQQGRNGHSDSSQQRTLESLVVAWPGRGGRVVAPFMCSQADQFHFHDPPHPSCSYAIKKKDELERVAKANR